MVGAAVLGLAGTLSPMAMAPARAAPMTAEQALVAHRKATSIGADPCRNPSGDEIVVCGRRGNPYAVPLYSAAGERYDKPGTTVAGALAVKDANAPCHMRGEPCLKPLPIITMGPGGKIRIGAE